MLEWMYSNSIPDLGTGQRLVVSFTPRPTDSWGKSHWKRDWVGPKAGHDAVEKRNIF
jgi:hypothetical protein